MSLATALAGLGAPAVAPPIADAATPDQAENIVEDEGLAEVKIDVPVGTELMSFTVHQVGDNMMFPQHGSHSSHVSHASSSPGYGVPDYVPSLPSAPYVPYLPAPVYAPTYAPPIVPPPASSTSPPAPPGSASDPRYLACTRAFSGFGVNDIASELGQVFGLAQNDAVNIATQALTAALTGNHYCDGYHGDGDR